MDCTYRRHEGTRAHRRPTRLTAHARTRMHHRGIRPAALEQVLDYGREVYVRGAWVYTIGRREVRRYRRQGIELGTLEGIQVVCSADDACVMTTYRNKNFRGLRR